MGVADDSFKKQGAVPFKWEIKPGVPKHHNQPPPQHFSQSRRTTNRRSSPLPAPPEKLRPPPSGSIFQPPMVEPRTGGSFRSAPRTRSERWRFDDQPMMAMVRRQSVSVAGCFLSPLLRRKSSSKKGSSRARVESEPDYVSDLETLSRWSVSSRKSFVSPFRDSPSSSSFSSYQSSPRPPNDAEWAGFGLF
ncbi:uncharacterized protein LOC107421018 [Ziziphus jujuba]|uniref:Uncharacterized protein n=2 Tax=Ziziphus jujuba TaxID=326968 RepID=A0A978V9F2_ZIZJJ|nr:uncharacterized protein LOC107421018 [Ziziphus jujuba]XP_048332280.1 uncharacterized protein LOC125423077 [Ziziphus jujuba var. spinosa]KAH7524532.1 hypothetical protein FEM48_Zijuj06G0129500 [Ziziphus jujuba var. spinosa]KAH7524537.1 hypothetical protein FEM48_Zijuj06G0130000 [Ziziphus jujuba var. spinosa]